MIKAIIIEDEQLIAREMKFKISEVAGDIEIIQILPSLKTAGKWFLQNAEPDLIFADIQLSDGTSFEIFRKFTLTCPVIFTTAYDEYAVQAFKVNGIDYLLKPIDDQDLRKAIDKARQIIESKTSYPETLKHLLKFLDGPREGNRMFKEQFVVNHLRQWIPVPVDDIACFHRESVNYLYTFEGNKYVIDYNTLEEVEELLNPDLFIRANRQAIIHIKSIASIKPVENQKLIVTLKTPLKINLDISREKAPAFKKWLDR